MEVLGVVDAAGADGRLVPLADHVQLALERGGIGHVRRPGPGTRGPSPARPTVPSGRGCGCRWARGASRGGCCPSWRTTIAKISFASAAACGSGDEKIRPTAYLPAGGSSASGLPSSGVTMRPLRALALEQRVRNLDQDAGAVAGVGLGTGGTAMLHALERLQAAIDDVVRGLPAQVREEPDATGVVFKRRVVQAALRPPGQLRVVHWAPRSPGDRRGHVPPGSDACEQCMSAANKYAFSLWMKCGPLEAAAISH